MNSHASSPATPFDATGAPPQRVREIVRLSRWLAPYGGRIALALGCSLLSAAAAVLVHVVLSRVLIDDLLLGQARDGAPDYGQRALAAWIGRVAEIGPLASASALYLALVLTWSGLGYVFRTQLARASQRALRDLRGALLAHVEHLPAAFYDRVTVGQVLTRITADVESLSDLLVGLGTLLGEMLPFALAALTMLRIDPVLLAEVSPMMAVVIVVTVAFRRFASPLYQRIRASLSRLGEHVHESLSGMETVQAFGREPLSKAHHTALNEENRQLERRVIRGETIQNPILESVSTLALALLLWLGGRHVIAGGTTLGSLVLFLQFTEMLFRPLAAFGEQSNNWLRASAACERIFRLLDWHEALAVPAAPRPLSAPVRGEIALRGLSFRYRLDEPVLEDLSLTIAPGETLAVVGPTGSGKTTLSRLICRLYDAPRASVFLDGTDVMDLDPRALRRQIGLIPQDFHVFPGTVHDNIALLDARVSAAAVQRAARTAQALSFIEALPRGFDTRLGVGGHALSHGQGQLLAFARAIAHDPPILILDEATASVDAETEASLQAALREVAAGRTCLIIAHRLQTVRDAHRIAVLDGGRLVELGTHDALIAARGLYRSLYDAQHLLR